LRLQEDYLYWQLIHFFVLKNGYRLVQISPDEREIWLENFRGPFPVIRVKRIDMDWGGWPEEDLETVGMRGENLRRRWLEKDLTVANIYVAGGLPVDYEHLPDRADFDGGRIHIRTFRLDGQSGLRELAKLMGYFPTRDQFFIRELTDPEEIIGLRNRVFRLFLEEKERERKILESGKPFFTNLLIAVQILAFLFLELMGGSTDPSVLVRFGAKYNPLILEGEWWRFFTPIFLHIGFFHLIMNTFALYYLGNDVERIFGRFRFLVIYFFAGFTGSLLSFIANDSISAGASGAIFGCFGALLYFSLSDRRAFFSTIGVNILMLIGINLLIGFTAENIDNAGHIGGLIGGFLAAGIVGFPRQRSGGKRVLYLLATAVLVWSGLYIGYHR